MGLLNSRSFRDFILRLCQIEEASTINWIGCRDNLTPEFSALQTTSGLLANLRKFYPRVRNILVAEGLWCG